MHFKRSKQRSKPRELYLWSYVTCFRAKKSYLFFLVADLKVLIHIYLHYHYGFWHLFKALVIMRCSSRDPTNYTEQFWPMFLDAKSQTTLNWGFLKRQQKFEKISRLFWRLLGENKVEDFFKFCDFICIRMAQNYITSGCKRP